MSQWIYSLYVNQLSSIPKSFRVYGVCYVCDWSEIIDHKAIFHGQGDPDWYTPGVHRA